MIKTLKIKNKRVISILLVFCMLFTLLSGSLAYFTDRVDTVVSAKAGSVSIELDYTGINLKDSDGKDILNPGDGRNFNYTVTSTGSKSIDVKETIILSAFDKNLQPLALNDTQSEFEIYETKDVTYDATKGWIPNDGALPITVKALDGNTITYNRPVYVLSGNSELGDDKREIEYNDADEAIPSVQASELMLIFKAGSSNTYQAAVLKAHLLVEAKQHRNTEAVEWIEVQSSTLTISNGNTIEVVPGATEFGPQESEDGNWVYKDNGDGTVTIVDTNKVVGKDETLIIPEKVDGKEVTGVQMDNILNNENINSDAVIEFENPEVAQDIKSDLIFTYTSDVEGVHITGLTDTGKKLSAITIPQTINGQPVKTVDYDGILNSAIVNAAGSRNLNTILVDSDDILAKFEPSEVFVYTDNSNGTATITDLTLLGSMLGGHFDIPETIDGLTVTSIGTNGGISPERGALAAAKFSEVTIPSTVTNIGTYAFSNNKNLKTVNYNTTITPYAFNGEGVFSGSPIEEVNFGAGITTIPNYFFNGITSTELEINSVEDITAIGDNAFSNTKNLTDITFNGEVNDGVVIPDTVTTIGGGAFRGCTKLEDSVTIPASVTSIGSFAFQNCTSIKTINYNTTTNPKTYNGEGIFENAPVNEVNLGAGITTIPTRLLANTKGGDIIINSVDTLTKINDYAFYNATGITSITFTNANITEIGNNAFSGCKNLYNIESNTFKLVDGNLTLDGLTKINEGIFQNCSLIKEVTIPASVTSVSHHVFSNTGIKTVNWNTTATPGTYNGEGIFENAPVNEVNFGAGITTVPTRLLANTKGGDVTINSVDTLTKINDYAFCNATGITSVTFTNANITEIGNVAFYNCTSISEITIPASVTSIGTNAFQKWTADQTIYVEGKTDVSGFANAAGLTSNCNATVIYNG